MKLGSFVGKESLNLTRTECESVIKTIEESMEEFFQPYRTDDFVWDNDSVYTDLDSNTKGLSLFVKAPINVAPYRITHDDDSTFSQYRVGDVFVPMKLQIHIYKEKGYDEAKEGKFFNWPKGYTAPNTITSYSASITLFGKHRRKGCHYDDTTVGISWTYTYGTELEDLDIRGCLDHISKIMKRCGHCPRCVETKHLSDIIKKAYKVK